MSWVDHLPQGDPCARPGCGQKRLVHRAEHWPDGDPCRHCGLPVTHHRWGRQATPKIKAPRPARVPKPKGPRKPRAPEVQVFAGLDGEGQGRRTHRYTLLACATEDGSKTWYRDNPEGLSTAACLEFLAHLPKIRIFSFAFGYDLTKILQDLPDSTIYELLRPELRPRPGAIGFKGPSPRYWNGYLLNVEGAKFSWQKARGDVDPANCNACWLDEAVRNTWRKVGGPFPDRTCERDHRPMCTLCNEVRTERRSGLCEHCYVLTRVSKDLSLPIPPLDPNRLPSLTGHVWDIFRFYGTKFVEACRAWKVGTNAELTHMQHMKDHRHELDRMTFQQVLDYCTQECSFMGQLAHKLTDAHKKVGLKLRRYDGAGSSGGAMLKKMGIQPKTHIPPIDERMLLAVASAFSGGWFENNAIGPIPGPVYNHDISSAYPYQLVFLPCLEHARWEWTDNEAALDRADVAAALIHYTLGDTPSTRRRSPRGWGPFTFRGGPDTDRQKLLGKGSTCHPIRSGGGWVWQAEYKAARAIFPGVGFRGAWLCLQTCTCQPFKNIPAYYRERVAIGKEGPGLVLKLGSNSVYGKLAQSVGRAPYNSWIWAGLVTSGTRAQMLDVIGLHKDANNVLMIATDGIYTTENVTPPKPRDTGTWVLEDSWDEYQERLGKNPAALRTIDKPLGGWETKVAEKGIFCARPGVYFPMQPTEKELAKVRARGVGRKAVFDHHQAIVDAWVKRDPKTPLADLSVTLPSVSRFCGAKGSIHRVPDPDRPRAWKYIRADGTGSVEGHAMPSYGEWVERPVAMTFHPKPKRDGLAKDGVHLTVRKMPADVESAPYSKAILSAEARELLRAELELIEQPDLDFCDYPEI